ncbi:MAG: hypothetical protein IIY94_03790 [Oscillospiraceae bacterium]|nr:hypothetical protein [Oscillospiraceae bacterium]
MASITKPLLFLLLFLSVLSIPMKFQPQQASGEQNRDGVRTIQYGTSSSGEYPLNAYQLGNGENVMILSFAIHGWEDHWNRDGEALVYLAEQVTDYLSDNDELVTDGDWTVYVLPCLNPDGLYLGTSCDGPGRCTTFYYDDDGQLSDAHGIDMNRCFPYAFSPSWRARNYTGETPLACREAEALADFVTQVKGSGYNILIDIHGWYSQIITSNDYGSIYWAFAHQFSDHSSATLSSSRGYFSAWAAYVEDYDSCLLELPHEIDSFDEFLDSGCVEAFEHAITELLQSYDGPY